MVTGAAMYEETCSRNQEILQFLSAVDGEQQKRVLILVVLSGSDECMSLCSRKAEGRTEAGDV